MDQLENAQARLPLKYGLFLLTVTLIVYAQTLKFPFLLFDDTPFIVQNAAIRHWSSIPSLFFPSGVDAAQHKTPKIANLYRPVTNLWLLLNYQLFGLHIVAWRAAALALYGLGVWLFWRVAYRLTKDDFTALGAALLFALHPLHVEGVAWLAGASVESVLCVFFFGGFLAYLRWRESPQTRWLALCGILTLCALMAKETGAALPLLIAIHAFLFRKEDKPEKSFYALRLGAALAGPVLVYSVLRALAIHDVVMATARHSWAEVLRSVPLFFAVYLRHAIWPVHLANWYEVVILPAINLRQFYLPLTTCLAFAAVTVWALVRKPLVGFLLVWWVVPLVPSFIGMFNFTENEFMHDRFTFDGLAGLCILAAIVLRRLPGPERPLFGFRPVSATALASLTVIFAILSATLIQSWRSDAAMAIRAIEISPTALRPRMLLGAVLQFQRRLDEALAVYRDALKIDPNRWEALYAYGGALANHGDWAEAIKVLTRGSEMAPEKTPFYLLLADLMVSSGHFDNAIRTLESGMYKAEDPGLLRAKLFQVKSIQNRALAANLH